MADVHGTCDERFGAVGEALARNLDGDELGASMAVDLDGQTVVDLWGGYRDDERTTPWTQDAIVNGWSTTKTVLSSLTLVDRDRRSRISSLMNRMAPGILGSDRSESYVRAVYDVVG